ncbi:MAG: hypothetical protein R3F13_18175 [Prosthecobacter sp.]
MPPLSPRLSRTIIIALVGACLGSFGVSRLAADPTNEPAAVGESDQTPADFLDVVGQNTKARWRMLFRGPPPTPPTDRVRTALILGTLLGDSYLVLQAGDAQQFRNNNQDVLAYCRTLGLGEKLLPRLMTQGNLAEKNAWSELRQELVDGHQETLRLLHEQMDEDLALLIDIGISLRLLEIVSTIIVAAPEADVPVLGGGSPALLAELRNDFDHLSVSKREEALLVNVRSCIDAVSLSWREAPAKPVTQGQAAVAAERLKEIMQVLAGK